MSQAARWAWFGVGVLLLFAAPVLVNARPPGADEPLSAVAVLERVRASRSVPFSGYAESKGSVPLPAEEALSSVAELLGETTSIRVWWAGPEEWRTATLRPTGETDHWHRDGRTVRWVYESKRVTVSHEVPVRLPVAVDALPNVLADQVLDGARPEELARIEDRRVAGRTALGLRLAPADPQAGVDHVDVWADAATGVPLRVDLFGPGGGPPALSTSLREVDFGRPDEAALTFTPPADASVHHDNTVDLAAAADRYADRPVPPRLAGLPSRVTGVRSVGVYGRGPTLLMALPLRHSDAERLHETLARRPGSACTPQGILVGTGPLQLLVTAESYGDDWLLAGTVTGAAVRAAAAELTEGREERCP